MFLFEELRTKSLETAFIHILKKFGTGTRDSLEKFDTEPEVLFLKVVTAQH
jgi:hypothetical protein